MTKRVFGLFFVFLLILFFTSCEIGTDIQAILDQLTTTLDVSVDFTDTQYGQTGSDWSFSMLFPSASDITTSRGLDPDILIASEGPDTSLGATLVKVNIRTNVPFYVTGTRIENIQYNLVGSGEPIDYFHPVLGDFCPVFSTLPTSQSYTGSVAAIPVAADTDNVFEVGLTTELSLWDHVDFDGDGAGLYFAEDQNEIISLQGSLFFEGYLADGAEFSGNFPAPLHLEMTISHKP
jgi:hypothetical protein